MFRSVINKKALLIGLLFFFNITSFSVNFSYFGRTGIIVDPSAYVMPSGDMAVGLYHDFPYTNFFVDFGFLSRLEFGGLVNRADDVPTTGGLFGNGAAYGHNKHTPAFAKFQIIKESKYIPAVAIGLDDFAGQTHLLRSEYIVATKYIKSFIPQYLTVGYARGEALHGPFIGTQILLTPKLSILAEYAPMQTQNLVGFDGGNRNPNGQGLKLRRRDKINYGIQYKPFHWLNMDFFIQRNSRFGFNVAFVFPLRNYIIPHIPRYFVLSDKDVSLIRSGKSAEFYQKALYKLDLNHARVYQEGSNLIIEYNNNGYLFETNALRKALSVLKVTFFPNVKQVIVVLKYNNTPITMYRFDGELVNQYIRGNVSLRYMLKHSYYEISPDYQVKAPTNFRPLFGIHPKFRTFLDDPSGPFKYDFSLDFHYKQPLPYNFFITSAVSFPIINNISSNSPPLMKNPVRSDVYKYLEGKNVKVLDLALNYIGNIFPNTFLGVSAGYNEMMFGGIGGDILHYFGNGRFAMGIGGDYVGKRDPHTLFNFRGYNFYDAYISTYYQFRNNLLISVKTGRFLAGDKGVRIQISREFKGFRIGVWYTKTSDNNGDFQSFNRGYSDVGIFITIPFSIFKLHDTTQTGSIAISPWSRDVGQLAGRPFSLYQITSQKMPFYMEDNTNVPE